MDLLHAMQALSQLSYSPKFFVDTANFNSMRISRNLDFVHTKQLVSYSTGTNTWYPLGDSNPCYRRERAVS